MDGRVALLAQPGRRPTFSLILDFFLSESAGRKKEARWTENTRHDHLDCGFRIERIEGGSRARVTISFSFPPLPAFGGWSIVNKFAGLSSTDDAVNGLFTSASN